MEITEQVAEQPAERQTYDLVDVLLNMGDKVTVNGVEMSEKERIDLTLIVTLGSRILRGAGYLNPNATPRWEKLSHGSHIREVLYRGDEPLGFVYVVHVEEKEYFKFFARRPNGSIQAVCASYQEIATAKTAVEFHTTRYPI